MTNMNAGTPNNYAAAIADLLDKVNTGSVKLPPAKSEAYRTELLSLVTEEVFPITIVAQWLCMKFIRLPFRDGFNRESSIFIPQKNSSATKITSVAAPSIARV